MSFIQTEAVKSPAIVMTCDECRLEIITCDKCEKMFNIGQTVMCDHKNTHICRECFKENCKFCVERIQMNCKKVIE